MACLVSKPSRKSLLEALNSKEQQDEKNYFSKSCPLKYSHPCCQGKGVSFKIKGPYTSAELCLCVNSCAKCGGKAQYLDTTNKIKSCILPLPNKICSLINSAHIPARYHQANLIQLKSNKNTTKFYRTLKHWLSKYSNKNYSLKGLLICGNIGIGKTYILASLAKEIAFRGFSVRFVDFFQLISEIKACYSDHQSEQILLTPLLRVDVLIIDELGKGRNTDYERTILDQLIMGRYNQNKTIIASTNYAISPQKHQQQEQVISSFELNDAEHLEQRVGNRIYSRLIETTYFAEIKGNDIRKQEGITWLAT
jgi:DNA replication protein DnaC